MNEKLIERLSLLIEAFRQKGKEFADVIKMGRTQLQDAVPMTLGQEFEGLCRQPRRGNRTPTKQC